MNAPIVVRPSSRDPYMPLESSGTYYYQTEGGNETWIGVSPQELADLLDGKNPPAFRTILSQSPDGFAGPLYFDFDGDLEEVLFAIKNVFIPKLQKVGVNLQACRWYFTGGRGVHIEVPQACFMAEPGFVPDLPKVYREMARALYVDTLDLRVYSGGGERKARQWRVPNVKRSNGAHKTPLDLDTFLEHAAVDEAEEKYKAYCSKPKPFPALDAPTLSPQLAELFKSSLAKVQGKAGTVRTYTKAEAETRTRFGGRFPASMDPWLSGQVLSGAGWNDISLQLGASAVAFGIDIPTAVAQCAGLIEAHESDGKYNTPTRRTRRLEETIEYCADGGYSFTLPALLSVVPDAIKPALRADFAGIEADSDGTDYVELLDAVQAPAQALEVARRINTDQSLSKTESHSLIKMAARKAGVPLAVLVGDLYDPADDGRPSVTVSATDFAGSVASAKAVLPLIPTLRKRGGKLIQLHPDRTVVEVTTSVLAELISSVATFRSSDGAKRGPDTPLLNAVLDAGYWEGVKPFNGFAEQPTLLDDNTIGLQPGYEPAYDPADFPEFEGSGEDALRELDRILSGFSFRSQADHDAAVAMVLTAVVRSLMKTAPTGLINAHQPGTGKTMLAITIALFGTASVTASIWPSRSEEVEKSLFALLIDNDPVILFDNMRSGGWNHFALAAITTTDRYRGRVMSTHDMCAPSTRKLFLCTANNAYPTQDMLRRTVMINLDKNVPPVGDRSFHPDTFVRGNRGRCVMLALRILQDFRASGAKYDLPEMGSFDEWTALIRCAMAHYGRLDPYIEVAAQVADNDDDALLAQVFALWLEEFGTDWIALSHLMREVTRTSYFMGNENLRNLYDMFDEVAGTTSGKLSAVSLGRWLGAQIGRHVVGHKLVKGKRIAAGQTWAVQPVEPVQPANNSLKAAIARAKALEAAKASP